MASVAEEVKQTLNEMRSAHEEFKQTVDKQIDEVRKAGVANADTEVKLEKINAAITELRGTYDALVTQMNRPGASFAGAFTDNSPEAELRRSAFSKYLRFGAGEQGRSIMTADEVRALSSIADKDGGFLVPTEWEGGLIVAAYNQAELRPICNVGTTGRDTVQMPALAKPVVAWAKTGLAVTEQQLQAGGERLEVFDLRALTLIHNNTLDDADADIWAELSMLFADAVAEAEDTAFATGAGNESPQGILADSRVLANLTKTGVAGALFDASHNGVDALIDMLQALKKTYRRNATWAMNSTVEGKVRQLKDSNGQYLWQPPVQAGSPATLLGRPLVNPESMPDVAANAFPVVLGDFRKGYRVRDRKGLTITRLVERYAEYDQTGFMIKRRTAGQVVLPEAFRVLKVAA